MAPQIIQQIKEHFFIMRTGISWWDPLINYKIYNFISYIFIICLFLDTSIQINLLLIPDYYWDSHKYSYSFFFTIGCRILWIIIYFKMLGLQLFNFLHFLVWFDSTIFHIHTFSKMEWFCIPNLAYHILYRRTMSFLFKNNIV